MRIRLTAAAPLVDLARRSIAGTIVRYGEYGQVGVTYEDGRRGSARVRVRAGSLRFPATLADVPLTLEHDTPHVVRGGLALVDDNPERLYAAMHAVDGQLGDQALSEALDRTRGALSFQLENVELDGDEVVGADVVAIGQVEEPGFNSARIDQVAAAAPTDPAATRGNPTTGGTMNPEQIARLAALRALQNLTDSERAELDQLCALEAEQSPTDAPAATSTPAAGAPAAAAPAAPVAGVAASLPAVPGGVPAPTGSGVQVTETNGALRRLVREITDALRPGGTGAVGITAAFSDVIHSDHTENVEPVAWSGELWSGLQYVPEWSDLFSHGTLTNWEGKGWRFTTAPEMQDYPGDKAAVPSGTVVTEDSSYEAARMAVGVDVDRKFYDFPNEAFVSGLLEKIRESWEIKLDAKVRAYVLANAAVSSRTASVSTTNADATVTAAVGTFKPSDAGATITGTGIPGGTTILTVTNSGSIELSANATATGTPTATIGNQESSLIKAAARVALTLKRRRVGKASWIVVNDEDLFDMLDVTEQQLPAFLDLYGIEPDKFRSSPDIAPGTVIGGVSQAAQLRVLPGSPIRVSAQHLANGGVDEAFFGYWAIEEHHTSGIASVKYTPAA